MALYREPIPHPAEVVHDIDLESAILERLYNTDTLRQSKATIQVEASGDVVTLTGNVRTDTHIDVATNVARRTPRVRVVHSKLIADTQIENRAAMALALDPRTRLTTDQISITALLGSLMLSGRVESEEKRAAALDVVETVPGVWEIVDALEVGALTRRGVAVADGATETTGAAGHGATADFVLEWPRKTKKGKVAPPLSAAALAKAGM
jgi:osmotically-inducible protein OsmY